VFVAIAVLLSLVALAGVMAARGSAPVRVDPMQALRYVVVRTFHIRCSGMVFVDGAGFSCPHPPSQHRHIAIEIAAVRIARRWNPARHAD
jgi:hypothetical protein